MKQPYQTHYAYLFEAHTIQKYVMQGGKLAEMVGASELLEQLTGVSGPLDDVLKELDLKEGKAKDYEFSRRGGGAFFILFADKEKANKVLTLWSLIVPQFAPGLEWSHAITEGSSQKLAIESGQTLLRHKRNQPSLSLPEVTPLTRHNPRTGDPASHTDVDQEGRVISLDQATVSKLAQQKGKLLFNKFIELEETKAHWQFPRNLEHKEGDRTFPYKGDNNTIAVLHADGNGLGQILMNLAKTLEDSDNYAAIFYSLSCKIDRATQRAARRALGKIDEIKDITLQQGKKHVLPLRPLILGGDDLTVLLRGDLALDYAHDFLLCFEEETEKELKALKEEYSTELKGLPDKMTGSAGIAFIRSNQPFYLGYQLAESLCSHAKNSSRATKEHQDGGNIPASLAFYRVTTSMIDDYNKVQKSELTVKVNAEDALLSLSTYGVYTEDKEHKELPDFEDLRKLKLLFQSKEVSRGPIRQLLTLMNANADDAIIAYRRWREVMQSRDEKILYEFDRLCKTLLLTETELHPDLPFAKFNKINEEGSHYCSFLADLSSLLAIEGEGEQS